MKYAILSDIHGNLEALQQVLEVCRANEVENFICLGDIVGYNANPKECLDLVRALPGIVCVKGNHDEYAGNDDTVMEGFNPHARQAALWTKSVLSAEDRAYLRDLPMKKVLGPAIPVTIVHATLDNPQAWGYIFDTYQAQDHFEYQTTQFSFCGHSHIPIAFSKKPVTMSGGLQYEEIRQWADRKDAYSPEELQEADALELELKPGYRYLINVGSVGQPRNRDTRASFAIYDSESRIIARCRIPYDIARAQAKIKEAGLPERLWTRLEQGI